MRSFASYLFLLSTLFFVLSCSEDRLDENELGSITGKVVVKGSNVPLGNVRISTNPVTSTVFTDEDGYFIIGNVPAGEYAVGARLDEYLATFEPVTVVLNTTANVIFELELSNANNKPPTSPVLISPGENEVVADTEVTFIWSASDPENDPLTFALELRNDRNEEVLRFEGISDTTYVYSELQRGTQYFWQVAAQDEFNEPVLSPVGKFKVMAAPVDNRFLFVRNIAGNNVIFSTDEQGVEYQLTSENKNSYRPRRNVAANRIAYLETTGAQVDIFTMGRDGTDKYKVTSTVRPNGFDLNEINIDWPKNSDRIYFPNMNKLYSIRSNGQGLNEIYTTSDGSLISEVAVSEDGGLIVLKTNDLSGYNVSIFIINSSGTILHNILSEVPGAVSGLDISVDNNRVLYAYDDAGFQSGDYRRLNSRLKLYTLSNASTMDISYQKPEGTNDLDPKFAPNESRVIFTNTSNDNLSQKNIYEVELGFTEEDSQRRLLLFENAYMPDWQ